MVDACALITRERVSSPVPTRTDVVVVFNLLMSREHIDICVSTGDRSAGGVKGLATARGLIASARSTAQLFVFITQLRRRRRRRVYVRQQSHRPLLRLSVGRLSFWFITARRPSRRTSSIRANRRRTRRLRRRATTTDLSDGGFRPPATFSSF